MNNEVLVAELLARERGSQQVPPGSHSRWRVIAVLAAIVLGCGVGAVLDRTGSPDKQQAQPAGQTSVVERPQHSDGSTSADTTLEPTSSAVPGTDVNAPPTGTSPQPSDSAAPPAGPVTQTSVNAGTPPTTGAPAPTTSQAAPTSSPHPTTTQHQQPPPTTKKTCVLGIFC